MSDIKTYDEYCVANKSVPLGADMGGDYGYTLALWGESALPDGVLKQCDCGKKNCPDEYEHVTHGY